MDPDYIPPLIAFLSTGTFILIGMRMWLNARLKGGQPTPTEELERLTEAVARLREENRSVREELAELHERVDFAERLLARASQPSLRQGHSPP